MQYKILKEFQGYKVGDISELTGVTEDTIKLSIEQGIIETAQPTGGSSTSTQQTNVEPVNLDAQRDAKCVPLAKEILKDMATLMVPEDANKKIDFGPIVVSMLTKTLAADTNIALENTYILQLILGIFGGLNRLVQQLINSFPADDVKFGRIQKELLEIVASMVDTVNVTGTDADVDSAFASVKEKINDLFTREKLSTYEIKYVMDNLFESFNSVNNLFNETVMAHSKNAEAKLFGISDMTDLTMKHLDDVLKKPKDGVELSA